MVKNKTGGSRHKKQARKNVNAPVSRKLRLAKEEGEVYAKITNIYGNGMAEVLCQDGVKRLLILRRKFKGRNKKDNFISIDGVVLVGRRLWEVVSDKKKQKVDLLYVYSQDQLQALAKKTNLEHGILPESLKEEEDIPFEISSKHDWKDTSQTLSSVSAENIKMEVNKNENKEEPYFDFDDI